VEQQRAAIRSACVASVLTVEAEQILASKHEWERTKSPRIDVNDEVQIAATIAAKKKFVDLFAQFAEDVRLAERFDYSPLYDDLLHKMTYDAPWIPWCYVIDSLKKRNFNSIPSYEDIPHFAGCSN
jgi:hypothetical protein